MNVEGVVADGVRRRAELRFDDLRSEAIAHADGITAGEARPAGWCLSTIARVIRNAPTLVEPVQRLQAGLADVGPLYLYPAESLHVSLLGCTQREPEPIAVDGDRAARVRDAVAEVLDGQPVVEVELGRLNLIGDQFFVEVLPSSSRWADTRKRLAAAVSAIGEQPIAYADAEPMHLNVARIVGPPATSAVREVLGDPSRVIGAAVALRAVELVSTDFVVAPESLVVIDEFDLRS
ncbi:hypothetical protein SUDANB95_04166 [Actinosynnema sp. ALI-1.44]